MIEQLLALDTQIFQAINMGMSNPAWDPILTFITHLGSPYLWFLIAVSLTFTKYRKTGFVLMAGLLINFFFITVFKTMIMRPRPYEVMNANVLDPRTTSSFPSGHTSTVFTVASILNKSTLLWLLAVAIGISRIYVGVHYPLDIIAGAIQGILIGRFVMMALTSRYHKYLKKNKLTRWMISDKKV
jgi:undecaprenyl-diphosphatase